MPETIQIKQFLPDAKPTDAQWRAMFDGFYEAFPKHRARHNALAAWLRITPDRELYNTILESIKAWKTTDDWQRDKGKFIPHPATWLRAERWEDEIEVEVSTCKPVTMCKCGCGQPGQIIVGTSSYATKQCRIKTEGW